ncbi:hypothetical protein GOBAR_AA00430 [Gossypium barbadense]|uniref:Uncharacterized protein n=1 Tax=Gossypium barbadense TaxID=3634 RepID=A0A2P5YX12_GOSBA|nr:hypothetical protein GOBAR_AA00430 [Gossypium barbadense]
MKLNKLKEQVAKAETTKAQALVQLERAKKPPRKSHTNSKTVNESKDCAIKATEDARKRLSRLKKRILDLETAREKYVTVITELDAAKQELRKVRQDCDASLEAKIAAVNQTEEAEHAAIRQCPKKTNLHIET